LAPDIVYLTDRRPRFRALSGAALLALGVVLTAPAPLLTAAGADPVSSCTTSGGVLVAVDFRHFGGSISRGCDATPTTGYDALHAAGFSTAGTVHDGAGFICRIDNLPTPAQDPCFNTPPATRYWSYWHAAAGSNSWSYSKLGAQVYHPGAGSVDAWVFGGTSPPSFRPGEVRSTPPPAPKPSSKPASHTRHPTPAQHLPRARASSRSRSQPHAATSATRSSATTGARPPQASASSTGGATSAGAPIQAASSATGGPSFVDATPVAAKRGSSGSLWPVLIGLLLAAALGSAAGWTVLRRRRAAR
jgi:hypothetical protein